MTRTTRQSTPVTPSRSDPIDAWLDVLIAMLALPKEDRQRVRDELEDHLRSRTEDLLITGLTEQQALKQAVSELGETAELAKQLSNAHKTPRTRRHLMHAALIALAGTTITLGALALRPNAPLPMQAVPGVAVEIIESNQAPTIPVRETTLEAVFDAGFAEATKPVLIHWDMLESLDLHPDSEINFDTDPLPGKVVFELLAERVLNEYGDDTISLHESESLIEVSSRSHFDERGARREMYSLHGIVGDESTHGQQTRATSTNREEMQRVADVILRHIESDGWTDMGGSTSMLSMFAGSMVITAPERVHEQVSDLLEDLREQNRARVVAQHRAATERIAQIRSEYERVMEESLRNNDEHERLSTRMDTIRRALRDEPSEELENERMAIVAISNRLRAESKELSMRVDFLRNALIDTEYASLLSERLPASSSRSATDGEFVTVSGTALRAGVYQIQDGLTLARLLAAAGAHADTEAQVSLIREGEPVRTYLLADLLLGNTDDRALQPGDQVAMIDIE